MDQLKAITCPICSNLCSSQAAHCPSCGHPISQKPAPTVELSSGINAVLSVGSVLGVVIGGLAAFTLVLGLAFRMVGIESETPKYFLLTKGWVLVPLSVVGAVSFLYLYGRAKK
jgi:hypothetical protein